MRLATVALVLAVVVAGCGGNDDTAASEDTTTQGTTPQQPTFDCSPAPAIAVENISLGLIRDGRLTNAHYVQVPASSQSQGWPEWFVAAKVGGSVGVWATSSGGDGPIYALDNVALDFTEWGAAAQPGSPAAVMRDDLRASEAAAAAIACVR